MTPQEREQFDALQKRVLELENTTNLDAYKSFLDLLVKDKPDVDTTQIDRTISIGAGGGSAQVLDYPNRWVRIILDGKIYRLGAWLE